MAHPYYHQYDEAVDLAERASKACYYARGKTNFVPAMTELVAALEKNTNVRTGDMGGCAALAQLARVFAFEKWDGRDAARSKRWDVGGQCVRAGRQPRVVRLVSAANLRDAS